MWALTLRQPWASLVLGIAPTLACGRPAGLKDVEIPPRNTYFRGDLLVHAGRYFDKPAMNMYWGCDAHDGFPRGVLLGVVRVVDVLPPAASCGRPWAQPGQQHWLLRYPRAFAVPVPWRGKPGLFRIDDRSVRRAVAEAELRALQNGTEAVPQRRVD